MYRKHKPLEEQRIVITGASSGIGLTTACLAAERGAKVVLASRNEEALKEAVEEIRAQGGIACYAVADVGDLTETGRISKKAIDEYGGFDTWVNNAGILVFGRCQDITLEDQHRLFKTNYFGTVHGSLIAIEHLIQHGGTLINVGSVDSDRSIPLQGPYAATKHAVKAWTDALRMELEHEGAPVSVSLIKPASIDTPLLDHAKNYLSEKPELPPPVYDPILVAKAILHCAEHPKRDIIVGGGGKFLSNLSMYGRMSDRYQEAVQFRQQHSGHPAGWEDDHNLYEPGEDGEVYGSHEGRTHRWSPYSYAQRHPAVTATSVAGILLGAVAATGVGLWLSQRRSSDNGGEHHPSWDDARGGWLTSRRGGSRRVDESGRGWTSELYQRDAGAEMQQREAARFRSSEEEEVDSETAGDIRPAWT